MNIMPKGTLLNLSSLEIARSLPIGGLIAHNPRKDQVGPTVVPLVRRVQCGDTVLELDGLSNLFGLFNPLSGLVLDVGLPAELQVAVVADIDQGKDHDDEDDNHDDDHGFSELGGIITLSQTRLRILRGLVPVCVAAVAVPSHLDVLLRVSNHDWCRLSLSGGSCSV